MKRTIRSLIIASLLVWPVAAGAGSVEDLGAAFDICNTDDSGACGQAVWSFVDITGDNLLTPAEISRFLRVASEWTVGEQSGLQDAIGNLGFGDAALNESMSRAGAVAAAFLSGPVTAKLVLDNFDYDGNGMLERGEIFADTDEKVFIDTVKSQMEQLPQYVAMAIATAQEQAMKAMNSRSDMDSGETMMTPEPEAAPEPEPEAAPDPEPVVALSEPEPMPEPVIEQPSFVLRNVDNMVLADGDLEVFVISGDIVNQTGDTLVPPDAIVQVLDDNGQVLKTWRLTPLRSELGPNESASFIGRLDDAPAGATNWTVVLADIE